MSNEIDDLSMKPIGVVRSPHKTPAGTPIQPAFARDAEGEVIVDELYAAGLEDLDGFERIWLIFSLHRAKPFSLKVIPYLDVRERGLFATRAPSRPNPIGMSAVRLLWREGNVLRVRGLDVLDETPLLDIKPYVPDFDAHPDSRAGWLDLVDGGRKAADDRFHEGDR